MHLKKKKGFCQSKSVKLRTQTRVLLFEETWFFGVILISLHHRNKLFQYAFKKGVVFQCVVPRKPQGESQNEDYILGHVC